MKFKIFVAFLRVGDIFKACVSEELSFSLCSFAQRDTFASSLFVLNFANLEFASIVQLK